MREYKLAKNIKIAIYEIVHLDWVLPLCDLLRNSPYKITFFVHKKMQDDIENAMSADEFSSYEWIYIEDQPINSLYRLLRDRVNTDHYDLFWLNTNDSKHIVFALLKLLHYDMKLVVNVHEINNFFRPHFSFNLKKLTRFLSKKILARMADAFILNARKMKEIVIEYKLTSKPCYIVTPVFYKESTGIKDCPNTFSVVIAGAVDKQRRDYQTVLLAWKKFIESKSTNENVELVLAGNSQHGLEIINICQNDLALKKTVLFFENEIPEQEFQQILANATILLSPQNIRTSTSDNIIEEYGLTKTSGNTYDAIRHAKPYVIPRALHVPEEIASSTIRYNDEAELVAIFRKFSNDQTALASFYQHAKENASKFPYTAMRQKVMVMLTAVSTPQ